MWRNHAKQMLATNMTHISIGSLPGSRTLDFKMKQVGALEDLSDDEEDEEEEEEEDQEDEGQGEAEGMGSGEENDEIGRGDRGEFKRSRQRARYELEQLTLETDSMISVLRLITPRLLVAARLPRREFRYEEDEVSRRIWGKEDGASDDEESEEEEGAGNGEYHEDCHEETHGKVGKLRILELRCEGMAEALAADYPAKLPNDFY